MGQSGINLCPVHIQCSAPRATMARDAGKGAHLWSSCPEELVGDYIWTNCFITIKNLFFPCPVASRSTY